MQVFKAYFIIIRKNLPMLSIYLFVFLGVSVAMSLSGQSSQIAQFSERRIPLAVIREEGDSALVDGLIEYLGRHADLVDVGGSRQDQQDALFFGRVSCILRIPKGFAQAFMQGDEARVETTSEPSSASGVQAEMLINGYLNCARLYARYGDMEQAEVAQAALRDLSLEAKVTMASGGAGAGGSVLSSFFNYAAYSTMVILLLGITSFMLVFNRTEVKRRTLCSPIPLLRLHAQSLLAHLSFTVAVWALTAGCGFALFGRAMVSPGGVLWLINLFLMSLVGLSIGYLVGNLIRGRSAQSAVANVVGLSMSFLCGAFVPQMLLGPQVLSVARFLPVYWYVKASDLIGSLAAYDWAAIRPVVDCFLIQAGFAAAIMLLTLAASKWKQLRGAQ